MKKKCKKNINMQNIAKLANTEGYASNTHASIKTMQNLPQAGNQKKIISQFITGDIHKSCCD